MENTKLISISFQFSIHVLFFLASSRWHFEEILYTSHKGPNDEVSSRRGADIDETFIMMLEVDEEMSRFHIHLGIYLFADCCSLNGFEHIKVGIYRSNRVILLISDPFELIKFLA